MRTKTYLKTVKWRNIPIKEVQHQLLFDLLPRKVKRRVRRTRGDHLLFDYDLSAKEYNHFLDQLEQCFACELPEFREGVSDTLTNLSLHISKITRKDEQTH